MPSLTGDFFRGDFQRSAGISDVDKEVMQSLMLVCVNASFHVLLSAGQLKNHVGIWLFGQYIFSL